MKANELRIGNVLDYRTLYGWEKKVVDCHDLAWISKNANEFNTTHRPISITEDLLLECGFVSNPYQDRYEKGSFHVQCDKTKGRTELWVEGVKDFDYLHQLQNLYLDRTGDELIINTHSR
jgi:hypothetical protein